MDFPINQQLLEETNQLKEARRIVRERLEKIESGKSQVSASVHDRVRTDYAKKLHEATQALLAKKSAVDRELATLYQAKAKVSDHVRQHSEELEELKFRHSLGEFDKTEFTRQSQQVTEKLAKFEAVLAAVNSNIERYEQLLADEPDLLPEGPKAIRTVAAPPVEEPSVHDVLSPDDTDDPVESYELQSSRGDYFTPNQVGATRAITKELEADTHVGAEPTPAAGPLLVVLEGANAGHIYSVGTQITIGRSKENHVALKDAKISRQHAVIQKMKSEWIITDLQSSNGVFVNGARIEKVALQPGDHIHIGSFVFEFRMD